MAAKEKWVAGSVAEARAILLEAFQVNPKVSFLCLECVLSTAAGIYW